MEVLHRLRDRGGGLTPAVPGRSASPGSFLFLTVILLLIGGCKAPPELRPDQTLQDSLGLTDRDRVHVVTLETRDGVELPEPSETMLRPGDHLSFVNGDRRARSIRFRAEELGGEARDWFDAHASIHGPLLADVDGRWVIDFSDAPPGRYPFVVLGGGEAGAGTVVVEDR